MEISPISFKGVYRTNDSEFSPIQYRISKRIRETLTLPNFADNRGNTPSDKLKDKGYDILISPSGIDKVDVFAVTCLQRGTGTKPDLFKESFFVGTYDNRSLFSSNDVNKAINDNKKPWLYYASMLLLPVLAVFGSVIKSCKNSTQENSQKIENSIIKTSLHDTVKTLPADTFKLVQKIK